VEHLRATAEETGANYGMKPDVAVAVTMADVHEFPAPSATTRRVLFKFRATVHTNSYREKFILVRIGPIQYLLYVTLESDLFIYLFFSKSFTQHKI
jgi:hypothetical protein